MTTSSEEDLQRRSKLKGYCAGPGYVFTWQPSCIPHFVEIWYKSIPEKWDHMVLVKVNEQALDNDPSSTWKATFESLFRAIALQTHSKRSGENKMPVYGKGPPPWWKPIEDENARKKAYETAMKINRNHGSIKNLTAPQADKVALEAMEGLASMAHLEALTEPTFQSKDSAKYPGHGVPDAIEIAAKVKGWEEKRINERVMACKEGVAAEKKDGANFFVTGDLAPEKALPLGKKEPSEEPLKPENASPLGEAEPSGETMQPDPALTLGRRVRANSVKLLRERTSSRASTPTQGESPQAVEAEPNALTESRLPVGLLVVVDRKDLYRQAEMATKRLAENEKSRVAMRAKPLTPPGSAPAASTPAPGPLVQGHQPGPSQRQLDPAGGLQNVSWGYTTHTRADQQMLPKGIMLFEKLPTCYRNPPTNIRRNLLDRPLIVNPNFINDRAPSVHFDDAEPVIHVLPFTRVRPDARINSTGHPDYLGPQRGAPPIKGLVNLRLSQYQSCEFFGQRIYRHDRDLLACHFPGCKITLSDHSEAQYLCLGCGPKSIIRYCSQAHMLGDNATHWKECGDKKLLLKRVIDHNTEPTRFWRFCPAIVDRTGWKTPERHRQRNHAMLSAGHYTLFFDMINAEYHKTLRPYIIQFPKEHPEYKELTARVERLLNVLFFDHYTRAATSYLYRLLRYALQLAEKWDEDHEFDLAGQLMGEFGIMDDLTAEKHPLCECLWSPKDTVKHHPECTSSLHYRHVSGELIYHGDTAFVITDKYGTEHIYGSLKAYAEEMEARYWILRAWRQQHQTIYWRLRVRGLNYPGVVVPETWPHPYLGAGWEGYGAADTDMHEAWLESGLRAGDRAELWNNGNTV